MLWRDPNLFRAWLDMQLVPLSHGEFGGDVIPPDTKQGDVPGSVLVVAHAATLQAYSREVLALSEPGLFLSHGVGEDWRRLCVPFLVECLRAQFEGGGDALGYVYAAPYKVSMSQTIRNYGWKLGDGFSKPRFLPTGAGVSSPFLLSKMFAHVEASRLAWLFCDPTDPARSVGRLEQVKRLCTVARSVHEHFWLTEGDHIRAGDTGNRALHVRVASHPKMSVTEDGITHAPTMQAGWFHGRVWPDHPAPQFEPAMNSEMHITLHRERGVLIRVVPGVSRFRPWLRMNPHIASMMERRGLVVTEAQR